MKALLKMGILSGMMDIPYPNKEILLPINCLSGIDINDPKSFPKEDKLVFIRGKKIDDNIIEYIFSELR